MPEAKEQEIQLPPEQELPKMAAEGIHAGFPSPAQDYMEGCIDLNRELVRHPNATFYGRVVGDSMIDAGIEEGDILVIDKSLEPCEGDMAVCFVDDICESSAVQGSLFDEHSEMRDKENTVSELMDKFNTPGKKLLHLATERSGHYSEGIRREHCSRLYSTSLKEIITVK